MLLIGSRAYNFGRTPKDYDLIATPEELVAFEQNLGERLIHKITQGNKRQYFIKGLDPVEIEVAIPGSNNAYLLSILDYQFLEDPQEISELGIRVNRATPALLYAFKMSHRYLKNSPHFLKTRDDILLLRKHFPYIKIHKHLERWYAVREQVTYTYSHPKLNQKKDDFFADDGVNYVFDHDTIHEAVKTFDQPAYQLIKEDQADVFCSKEKFQKLPRLLQLLTVLEEAYVLALERHQIPNSFHPDPKVSFDIALEKICTSISSGWWREFAWENYDAVQELYSPVYVDKFDKALINNRLKPYRKAAA